MLAEIADADLNAADEQRVALDIGFRHKIGEKLSFSGALVRDLHACGGQAKQTYATLTLQMDVGK